MLARDLVPLVTTSSLEIRHNICALTLVDGSVLRVHLISRDNAADIKIINFPGKVFVYRTLLLFSDCEIQIHCLLPKTLASKHLPAYFMPFVWLASDSFRNSCRTEDMGCLRRG